MNILIELRGNNKELGIAEIESLLDAYKLKHSIKPATHNLIQIETKDNNIIKRILSRTAFIKHAYNIIKIFPVDTFIKELTEFSLSFKGTYFVRSKAREISENEIAEILWKKSKDKKVCAENPENFFYIYKVNNKIYLTKKIFENKKQFLNRMPKKRPVNSPFTLKSDLARALVNLLAIKKGTILDPFCGVGGLLLEAESMSLKIIGIDIKWKNIIGAKKNIKHYFNTDPTLILADSRDIIIKQNTIDGIVTDIPYGKSTSVIGKDLYEKFLDNAKLYLKNNKRIVVVYSNYIDIEDAFKKRFNLIYKIREYINKSMIRYIIVGVKKDGV